MLEVGKAATCIDIAEKSVGALCRRVATVEQQASERTTAKPRVVLLEWFDPPFSAGHWSPALVRMAGGIEMIGREGERSKSIDWQEVVDADPQVLVVACCGFDIERTRQDLPILRSFPKYESLPCVQNERVHLVDGNSYFSRPGPRLVDSLELLVSILRF